MENKNLFSAASGYLKLGTQNPYYELMAAAYTLKSPISECEPIVRQHADTFFRITSNLNDTDWSALLQHICNNIKDFICFCSRSAGYRCAELLGTLFDENFGKYVISMLEIPENSSDSIYCPDCNLSLFSFFDRSHSFDCYDNSELNIAFSKVIHDLADNHNATFHLTDTKLLADAKEVSSHHYTIAKLPYDIAREDRTNIEEMVKTVSENLQPDGKAMLVCLPGFLFNMRYRNVREQLLSKKLIRKIVTLPNGTFATTLVSPCLILLDNSTRATDDIDFVDFSDMSFSRRDSNAVEYNYKENERAHTITVKFEEVDAANLSPSAIRNSLSVKKEMESLINPTPLSELVSTLKYNNTFDHPVRIVSGRNLYEKQNNGNSDYSYIEPRIPGRFERLARLDCDCILLPLIFSSSPKPVVFRHSLSQDYYITNSIVALRLNSEKTSLEYIASELTKHYVEVQLDTPGSTVRRITVSSLLSALISLPESKEEQLKSIINSQEGTIADITRDLIRAKEKEHEEYLLNLRARKHTICHTLAEAKYSMELIDILMEKSNGILDINAESELSASELLATLRTSLYTAIDQVTSLIDSNRYGSPSEYDIRQLIEEFIQIPHNHPYTYNVNGNTPVCDSNLQDDALMVSINKDDLFVVFREIVNNAVKYGFENEPHIVDGIEQNTITFCLTLTAESGQQYANITIGNNGNPLPEGMTPEGLFTWGVCSASGSGIGGWQIKNAIEHFGGKIYMNDSFCDMNDIDYPVSYSIMLPITNIIAITNDNEK